MRYLLSIAVVVVVMLAGFLAVDYSNHRAHVERICASFDSHDRQYYSACN